jgi:hypothetical protein
MLAVYSYIVKRLGDLIGKNDVVRAKLRATDEIAVVNMFEHALERGLADISTDTGLVK